jgi:hypothetical protein
VFVCYVCLWVLCGALAVRPCREGGSCEGKLLPPTDGAKYLVGLFDPASKRLQVLESPFRPAELRFAATAVDAAGESGAEGPEDGKEGWAGGRRTLRALCAHLLLEGGVIELFPLCVACVWQPCRTVTAGAC